MHTKLPSRARSPRRTPLRPPTSRTVPTPNSLISHGPKTSRREGHGGAQRALSLRLGQEVQEAPRQPHDTPDEATAKPLGKRLPSFEPPVP